MDAEIWRRARALFDELADTPSAEWTPRLDALDLSTELRAEVLALLKADRAELLHTAMEDQAPQMLADLADADRDAQHQGLAGQRVGAFRLVRELGRGGMGTVWLADRVDGEFQLQVAIKLIRPGWDADEVLARFRAERQILAGLTHPNIARLIDGGVTADGRPWLALEYVDGVDLRQYCDRRHLDLVQRMSLFLTVCDAISHAHQHLVVHRDLKPSNLLVTAAGEVKLLDFGIAKLIDANAAQVSATRVFTPEYAAPEQVRGETVTTAVDVYALGLLLYELLTGRRPYKVNNSTPAAYERAILDQEPTRPSVAVTRNGDDADAAALAAQRELTPQRLRRELRGDLDAIVLKALRKDPAQRYASAADLAADVVHHLRRRPVEARRGGWRYRAGRFLRRHALAVGLGSLAALALIGGLLVALWQAHALRSEVLKSSHALNFMIGVFTSADTGKTGGREITAVALLDQARERIRTELSDPEARSELLLAIARAYRGLSNSLDTLPLTDEAVQLRRDLGAPLPLARALALRSASQHDLRKFEDSLASLDEGDKLELGNSAEAQKVRIELLSRRANTLMSLSRIAEAETAFGRAYQAKRALFGDADPSTQETGIYWSHALMNTDQYLRAREVLEPIVASLRASQPAQPDELAGALDALGRTWQHEDPARTVQYGRESLAQERIAYGDESTHTALRLTNLADYLGEVGAYEEAMQVAEKSLAIRRAQSAQNPGSQHVALVSVARVHLRRGDGASAETLLNEAIALRDKPDTRPSMSVAWALQLRGQARALLGRTVEARADFERAAPVFEDVPASSWRRAGLLVERVQAELPHADAAYDCADIETAANTVQRSIGSAALLALWSEALAGACALQGGDSAGLARVQRADSALRARLPGDDARLRWLDRFAQARSGGAADVPK